MSWSSTGRDETFRKSPTPYERRSSTLSCVGGRLVGRVGAFEASSLFSIYPRVRPKIIDDETRSLPSGKSDSSNERSMKMKMQKGKAYGKANGVVMVQALIPRRDEG